MIKSQKKWVIINLKDFNKITKSNIYSIFLQTDIIQTIAECSYIFIFNAASFFYQWQVYSLHHQHFSTVSHHEQKIFKVTVMNFINSVFYIQQQIENVLWLLQEFVWIYIDNLVVFSCSQNKHMNHLYQFFFLLMKYNIVINLKKIYIDFSTMHFFD